MTFPDFACVDIAHIPENLDKQLKKNRKAIAQLLQQKHYDWDNLLYPLESLDDELHHFWSPISHLQAVADTPELRQNYTACLAPLSSYHTEIAHNHALFEAIASIHDAPHFSAFPKAQKKVIQNQLRDFKLAGVHLALDQKKRFAEISKRLSELSNTFSNQVLDATHGWHYHTTDPNVLLGIPEQTIATAKTLAEKTQKEGWILTLDMPVYIAIITHAKQRDLREAFYKAYVTRASDKGPQAGQWDNSAVMAEILTLKQELAQLLGFPTYAHYSLATKMVKEPEQVLDFLSHLNKHIHTKAAEEYRTLCTFAKAQDGWDALQPWDISYYSERLREQTFDFTEEALRPYFPASQVIQGLFAIVHKLFDIHIQVLHKTNTWHPDVTVYTISNAEGQEIARCYMDLYARKGKRGGAWMDECQVRRQLSDGQIQLPYAYLTCNFQPPLPDKPALLTHHEVVTLFHEFGHCLHHMLTQIPYAEVSGINGVPWDAVELPSQFLENWAWQEESLALISAHVDTQEPLPKDLFDKIYAAKNFHAALGLARQLEFALFDFQLHLKTEPATTELIQNTLDAVRQAVTVVPIFPDNRFQHSFSHIFAGGYAAGYYSYLWAEVMSSDAFAVFQEQGLFDPASAQRFLRCILQQGGAEEPAVLFRRFRGRNPDIKALLHQNGILT